MLSPNNLKYNRQFAKQGLWSCLCGAYFMLLAPAQAQRIDFTYKTYGLEVDGDNVIQNASHLDDFFEGLYQLQLANDRKINIAHIGDSHIQADYMTSIIRRNFHRHFGNAGRGLIVPLRVAGTNEPNNFKTVSNASWKSKRCVFPEQPLPIGIGGVTIETSNPEANLEIFMNDLWLDYTFNALTLFYEKDEKSFDFSVRDTQGKELSRINVYPLDSNRNFSHATWEKKIDAVTIRSVKANPEQSRAMIYGAVLENSMNGVLYHTVGVNGAKFRHYNEAKYFAAQTAALHTDLFIISLGTNESIDYPYPDKSFASQVDMLLSNLRQNNPMAKFILVTPQDVFRRKNKPNPGIMQVREQIIRYAVENGLAFYDLFRAMGGEHSAKSWSQNTLLSGDGIHLTKDGYEYQGNLFYHALMKGYNLYVPTRHP
ncbi:MAG: GDSL-type esterase/lipase family protein [Cyclobacteriaceae bacterium]